jgi:hypothetical protein
MNHPDLLARALLEGFTFAEAAYSSEPALSWMMTVVGDPLYSPFKQSLPEALEKSKKEDEPHRAWLKLQQVKSDIVNHRFIPTPANLRERLVSPPSSPIAWEGYGDLLKEQQMDPSGKEIIHAWENALNLSSNEIDQIRISLKLVKMETQLNQIDHAKKIFRALIARYPNDDAFYDFSSELRHLSTSSPSPLFTDPSSGSSLVLPQPPQPPQPPEKTFHSPSVQ